MQFNAIKEFSIPWETWGLILEKNSSSEDIKMMVGMLEKFGKKNGKERVKNEL